MSEPHPEDVKLALCIYNYLCKEGFETEIILPDSDAWNVFKSIEQQTTPLRTRIKELESRNYTCSECGHTMMPNDPDESVYEQNAKLESRNAELEKVVGECEKKMREAHDEIVSYHIDWGRLNTQSPDHDPSYNPNKDMPLIVGRLKQALSAIKSLDEGEVTP